MAISVINTQGTVITVGGAIVECPQLIGDLEETREDTEYGCISTDEVYIALGKITRAPFTMQTLYKPEGIDGQEELNDSFYNIINKEVIIELSDADTTVGDVGASGTLITFDVKVKGRKLGLPVNGAVTTDYTCKISGEIVKTAMVPGTA